MNRAHLAYSTNILIPRFFVETQVLVEAEPDVVAVQSINEFAQM
jgi:hypothetical protein